MHKILVTRTLAPEVMNKLSQYVEVDMWDQDSVMPRDQLLQRIAGKDGLLCLLTDKIDAEVLDAAGENLRTVSTMSVGFDHIDVKACKEHGVTVGFTPDVLTDAVADLAVGMMLSASRRMLEANMAVKNGKWDFWRPYWMTGRDLYKAKVGIVGLGRIGAAVAKRLKGFECEVLYTNMSRREDLEAELGVQQCELDALLAESDFISVHVPLMADNQNMFNADLFGKMKPEAVFVNTSRGGLVDQDALYDALKNQRLYAAALDVTEPEPLPVDHPLLSLPNCLVMPHIGSASIAVRVKMGDMAADNLLAGLARHPLVAEVKVD